MVEIKQFGLENFKVFNSYQEFEIKPITILTGKNNSGKSSLIKALKFLSYTFRKDILSEAALNDADLSLGDFSKIKNFSNSSNKIKFKINNTEFTYVTRKEFPEITYLENLSIYKKNKIVISISILFESVTEPIKIYGIYVNQNTILEMLLSEKLNKDSELRSKISFILSLLKNKLIDLNCILDIMPGVVSLTEPFGKKHIVGLLDNYYEYDIDKESTFPYKIIEGWAATNLENTLRTNFLKKNNENKNLKKSEFDTIIEGLIAAQAYSFSILDESFNKLFKSVAKCDFIEPYRGDPERVFRLFENKNLLNDSLDKYYRENLLNKKSSSESTIFLLKWLKEFGIGTEILMKPVSSYGFDVSIKGDNGKSFQFPDLGFGIMQLFAILLHISFHKYCDVLVIEEPESHLHPDLQSKFANFLVDVNKKFKIKFIIETHSEYLIRKLQYLTAKKKIKPNDSGEKN
jgi:predicted ATPase